MVADAVESALWIRWRETKDPDARDELVKWHAGRARVIAAGLYLRRRTYDVGFDDYRQLALLGLLESIERFDPTRGVLFATYAEKRIRGSVQDGIPLLSERYQQWSMRKRVVAEHEKRSWRAGLTGCGESAWIDGSIGSALALVLDGSGMICSDDERSQRNIPFYDALERRQFSDLLLTSVKRLSGREKLLIWRHYFQQIPIAEIAEREGLSRGRASQIHKNALVRLREMMGGPST